MMLNKKQLLIIIIIAAGAAATAAGLILFKAPAEQPQEQPIVSIPITDINCRTFDCYDDYYTELVTNYGVGEAFADLKIRYDKEPNARTLCHPIVHVIGRIAVDKYPTVSEAYMHGDSFCWSGYYHGVLEGVVGKIGRDNLTAQLDTICAGIPGKESYSFDYYNCVHGLGHGVMAVSNDELFVSLDLCSKLTGIWEQHSCAGGVFMENIITHGLIGSSKFLKPDEPHYPCSAVDDKYKDTCYLMQTSYMLTVSQGNFSKVFDLCAEAGSYAEICYQSLGRDASGNTISNVNRTREICMLGKDFEQQNNCIIGAAKDFVAYFHSDVQARQLCASLTENLQQGCFSTVKSYYGSFV